MWYDMGAKQIRGYLPWPEDLSMAEMKLVRALISPADEILREIWRQKQDDSSVQYLDLCANQWFNPDTHEWEDAPELCERAHEEWGRQTHEATRSGDSLHNLERE